MGASPAPLELREPEDAFDAIEEWLREQGFFGAAAGAKLVADLYLGYGLSQTIRWTATPAPLEPCAALPLAACVVRPTSYVVSYDNGDVRVGDWERAWGDVDYGTAVERVRAAIARGDVYQVNLVQHLSAAFAGTPAPLAARLAALHPDPFVGPGWAVVSASPELFLSRRGRRVWTTPIKGTRPLGEAVELRGSVAGGVVWDSDPDSEVEESWTKARPLLEAIGSRVDASAGLP
jgi:para-aminobenzoate synthetase component I